jgi:hypothetical protein
LLGCCCRCCFDSRACFVAFSCCSLKSSNILMNCSPVGAYGRQKAGACEGRPHGAHAQPYRKLQAEQA